MKSIQQMYNNAILGKKNLLILQKGSQTALNYHEKTFNTHITHVNVVIINLFTVLTSHMYFIAQIGRYLFINR